MTLNRASLILSISMIWTAPSLAQDVPEQAPVSTMAPTFNAPLTFMDSKLFDARLSKELSAGNSRVEVEVSGRVPLSNIPPRIDNWVTRVGEEGKVEVKASEPAVRTRALFALIPMVFTAMKRMNEERMFEPAKNYDATIYYRKDANGETLLEKIVFTKKPG